MSLCEACRSIPFRKFITGGADALRNDGLRFNEAGRTSSAFLDDLCWNERRCAVTEITRLAQTCSLCAFIMKTVKDHTWVLVSSGKAIGWRKIKTAISRNLTVWMEIFKDECGIPCLGISLGTADREETDWLKLHLRRTLGSPLTSRLPCVVFQETLHTHTLRRMVSWLENCNTSHYKCSHLSTRAVPLPTRILDVSMLPGPELMLGKHQNWRELFQGEHCNLLQTSKGQVGRYAALSYCWGDSLPLETTTTNLQAHESAIGFGKLPRTLQDAVMTVRYLGIEYIWIDCLCILQDSKADWEREAARMADIYSNAYLTISASRAKHCGEGFLGTRNIDPSFRVCIEDQQGSLELYFCKHMELTDKSFQPLESRGWAFQESLLSHRILGFGEDQMSWGCAHTDTTESYLGSAVVPHHRTNFQNMLPGLRRPMSNKFRSSDWALFTTRYSARKLTYETDTFSAISGIVQRIQKVTGDTYYAGLWKQHFLEGLLWYLPKNSPSSKGQETDFCVQRKRIGWIAPSWSWASIAGDMSYPSGQSPSGYLARLEECSITPSGLDPFGALTAGFARVTGPVTSITNIRISHVLVEGHSCQITLSDGRKVSATVIPDFIQYESCNALMITPYLGICIKHVKETADTYVRVGIVSIWIGQEQKYPLTASDHLSSRTVMLV